MKDAVVIKSFANGIKLFLDAERPFSDILNEICFKFSEAKNFFGKGYMALALEGRELTRSEEIQIIDAIRSNSNVNIACIVGKDEETEKIFVKAVQRAEKRLQGNEEGQFYIGSLKDGQVLETEHSLIVLGDVDVGCAVVSAKNIIVLGGLYGEAYAGGNGMDNAYVAALEMEPEKLKIGDFKYKKSGKNPKFGLKPKTQPKIAHLKSRKIVFDNLTKELPGF